MTRVIHRLLALISLVLLIHLVIIKVSNVMRFGQTYQFAGDLQSVKENESVLSLGRTAASPLISEPTGVLPPMFKLPPPYLQAEANLGYVDLLSVPPPRYLPNYRNPCWAEPIRSSDGKFEGHNHWTQRMNVIIRNKTGYLQDYYAQRLKKNIKWKIRCLPYFYVAGVTKCGTSDLFTLINNHPLISSAFKEIHWWSSLRTGPEYVPIKQYIDLMDIAVPEIENYTVSIQSSSDRYHPIIIGEGSPSTFWRQGLWTILSNTSSVDGPRTFTAQYIHHITPQAKIILIFRNPALRIYSQYYYAGGSSPEHFHKSIQDNLRVMEDCLQHYTEWYCVNTNLKVSYVNLAVGMYAVFLEKWLDVFPRKQLYILRLEDYAKNRTRIVNDIFKFLGVGMLPETELEQWEALSVKNSHRSVEPMLGETRELLDKFYQPHNERLANILMDDRYKWTHKPHTVA